MYADRSLTHTPTHTHTHTLNPIRKLLPLSHFSGSCKLTFSFGTVSHSGLLLYLWLQRIETNNQEVMEQKYCADFSKLTSSTDWILMEEKTDMTAIMRASYLNSRWQCVCLTLQQCIYFTCRTYCMDTPIWCKEPHPPHLTGIPVCAVTPFSVQPDKVHQVSKPVLALGFPADKALM